MARRRRRKKTARRVTGKAAISKKRGHKPLKLLRTFRAKMEKNIVKLDNLIRRREAAGE